MKGAVEIHQICFTVDKMTKDSAILISQWTYPEPYSMYSMDGSVDCLQELLNGQYYSVNDSENELIGYYCFDKSAQVPAGKIYGLYNDDGVIDIGLGLRPDLCGQRMGSCFLDNGLEFARKEFSVMRFRLTVASFNTRAVRVYERTGFQKIGSFIRPSENSEVEFWVMTL